jgi:flagellar assembly protein FliH
MSLTLFAEDFDARAAVAVNVPAPHEQAPPPPSYSQEDLDAACAQARAAGHAEGLAAAAAAQAAQATACIAKIADHLQEAGAAAARVTDEGVNAFARLLFAALLAGFPRLRKLHGEDELRTIVRRAMPGMLRETSVVFHVHPAMVPMIESELASVPLAERQHMTFAPSEDIPLGDARIAWPNGAAIRDTVKIHHAIGEILEQFGLAPDAPATDVQPR